ncbi:energy transducer TonB [Thermomonas brevis]
MIHAPAQAHASSHPHGSRSRPDPARILTLSGTVALNLLAFGVLMVPIALPPPVVLAPTRPTMTIRDIVKPPEPVIVDITPIPHPTPATPTTTHERRSIAPPAHDTVAAAVVSDTGNQPAADTGSDTNDALPPASDIGPASGPAPMQLAYRSAPAPAYPRTALLRQWSGTVLLQVVVDVDGRPLEVSIARSSGHRELDEAARLQVLKRWSFQPATRDGAPVQAIGLVPVEFNLRR